MGEYKDENLLFTNVKWGRISDFIKNAVIFEEKPDPKDIRQGILGDCYYLAGLAALAERPDRIYNLFLETKVNNNRHFSVRLLYKGKWVTIDMD